MKDIQRSYSKTPNREYPQLKHLTTKFVAKKKEQTKLLLEWLHKSKRNMKSKGLYSYRLLVSSYFIVPKAKTKLKHRKQMTKQRSKLSLLLILMN